MHLANAFLEDLVVKRMGDSVVIRAPTATLQIPASRARELAKALVEVSGER